MSLVLLQGMGYVRTIWNTEPTCAPLSSFWLLLTAGGWGLCRGLGAGYSAASTACGLLAWHTGPLGGCCFLPGAPGACSQEDALGFTVGQTDLNVSGSPVHANLL